MFPRCNPWLRKTWQGVVSKSYSSTLSLQCNFFEVSCLFCSSGQQSVNSALFVSLKSYTASTNLEAQEFFSIPPRLYREDKVQPNCFRSLFHSFSRYNWEVIYRGANRESSQRTLFSPCKCCQSSEDQKSLTSNTRLSRFRTTISCCSLHKHPRGIHQVSTRHTRTTGA